MEEQVTIEPKAWLQRIKEESWEAELLVSAIGIFGSFQLFNMIDWVINRSIDLLPPAQYFIAHMIAFTGLMAISMLTSMFIIHFFLRFYWVGLLGLNSVFPDYGEETSLFSKQYTKLMAAMLPKMEDSVQRVDEQCSVIFSSAYCLLIIYGYVAFLVTVYLFIYNALLAYIPQYILLVPPFLLLLLLVVQSIVSMIANLTRFKEHEKLQTSYFNIVRLTNMITVGPFYRNVLQIIVAFGSNYKAKKNLAMLILLCFVFGIGFAVYRSLNSNIHYLFNNEYLNNQTMIYPQHYADQNQTADFLLAPEIPSDVITEPFLKIFIPMFKHEDDSRQAACNSESFDPEIPVAERIVQRRAQQLACFKVQYKVAMNSVELDLSLKQSKHPVTEQTGLIGYVPTDGLGQGENSITIQRTFLSDDKPDWVIPFYYSHNAGR